MAKTKLELQQIERRAIMIVECAAFALIGFLVGTAVGYTVPSIRHSLQDITTEEEFFELSFPDGTAPETRDDISNGVFHEDYQIPGNLGGLEEALVIPVTRFIEE
jgi:hypothetical protein